MNQEPGELNDDLFVKHLIVYKRYMYFKEYKDEQVKLTAHFRRCVRPTSRIL